MSDFLDDVSDLLKRHIDEPMADKITDEICKTFGGGQIYVRKKLLKKWIRATPKLSDVLLAKITQNWRVSLTLEYRKFTEF